MSTRDRYASFASSHLGRSLVKLVGLPDPPRLRRYRPGDPMLPGPVLLGGLGRMISPLTKLIESLDVEQRCPTTNTAGPHQVSSPNAALVFDATSITNSTRLRALYDFFHPYAGTLCPSGRVVILGTAPEHASDAREAAAQQALEGFVRSVGKELGRGATAHLIYAAPGAEDAIESTLRFLLSAKSAYVSGQVLRVGPAAVSPPDDWETPFAGKVALVTGAARGIGAGIAAVLARDGAHVVCLDVPDSGDMLANVAGRLSGTAFHLDLTTPEAPEQLAEHLQARHGAIDVVVHNAAGASRNRNLAGMAPAEWDCVLDVNLCCQERINDALLGQGVIREGGRLVGIASISAIAGHWGQTNYATSKAGVVGLVRSMAPDLAARGVTINAVAPGFIETPQMARMPMLMREVGRRLNNMYQAGQPVDVAEAVAFFASPASAGVTGNVLRVCGQSVFGA
jgi:3-oxoacyl-[acyl-carrier protein] reductase